jgi:hypothetical protein
MYVQILRRRNLGFPVEGQVMKKSWVVMLLVLAGAMGVCAQTGEVYSLNVVGFQKLTAVSQGLVLVSTPFERSPNTLDDVIGPQLTGGKSEGVADQVIMWDAQSQQYERYWLKSGTNRWFTLYGQPATNAIILTRDGFWLRNQRTSNQVVIVSGDVVTGPAITNDLVPGLNLVSYPYSSQIDINQSALTNGKAGKSEGAADQLVLWDEAGKSYRRYWLRQSDRKWCTLTNTVAVNVFVGGGVGFWYRNVNTNAFAWVETRPYTL